MKKVMILLIVLMAISVGILSGCTEQSEESKFIGTWIDNTDEINVYHEDGIITVSGEDDQGNYLHGTGTWKLENGRLFVTFKGSILTFRYSFSSNNKTLTITNIESGATYVCRKQ